MPADDVFDPPVAGGVVVVEAVDAPELLLVLLVDGVVLATLVGVELPDVVVAGAGVEPDVVERAAAVVVPAVLVELVDPLLMRVLALVDAVLAVVPDDVPVEDELDDPSRTQAETNNDATTAIIDFEYCAARG